MNKALGLTALLLLSTCQYPLRNATAQTYRCVACPGDVVIDLRTVFPNYVSPTNNQMLEDPMGHKERPHYIPTTDQLGGPAMPAAPLNRQPPTGEKVQIKYEPGGLISGYESRWRVLDRSGHDVEILGLCQSACTTILGIIPPERLCIGPNARFNFHSARTSQNGPRADDSNAYMFHIYPQNIRDWIVSKGGYLKLPYDGMWVLLAPEMWAMGFRKCN